MNACYILQASDKSDCCVSSDDISSRYIAPSCVNSLAEMSDMCLTRVTFTGKVIHSLVCTRGISALNCAI